MKITNKHNFPETLVRAVLNDPYNKGHSDFSCTELIKPARLRFLEKRFDKDIVIDVSDSVFRLYGQLGHTLLERAGTELGKNIVEKRLYMPIEIDGKEYLISAQIDSLSLEPDGTLIDWKFTTVFGFKTHTLPKQDWVYQLNIQNLLIKYNREALELFSEGKKVEVKKIQIWGLLRDWRPGEKRRDPQIYPETCSFHTIEMMPDDEIEVYLKERIRAHVEAFNKLPECSPDEHWNHKRCEGYCDAVNFCTQYKLYRTKIK